MQVFMAQNAVKYENHCGPFYSSLLTLVRGWGELVNVFRLFICGGMIIMDTNVQRERAAYGVQSPLP